MDVVAGGAEVVESVRESDQGWVVGESFSDDLEDRLPALECGVVLVDGLVEGALVLGGLAGGLAGPGGAWVGVGNGVGGAPDRELTSGLVGAGQGSPRRVREGLVGDLVGDSGDEGGALLRPGSPGGVVVDTGGDTGQPWQGSRSEWVAGVEAPGEGGGLVAGVVEGVLGVGCGQGGEGVGAVAGDEDEVVAQGGPGGFVGDAGFEGFGVVLDGGEGVGAEEVLWIIDRYRVKTDKASGIINDPNRWADEHHDPRYIVDLIKRVTRVSVDTVRIINALPELPL